MSNPQRLSMFEAFGIELEYMLVDRDSLDVRPVSDRLLQSAAGFPTSDLQRGETTWSNELVLHVLELKGTLPTAKLPKLARSLQQSCRDFSDTLESENVILLPGAMHPWMDPATETRLWPHECAEIYQAYHRIFDCHRHGWANVQSVHLNLPFADDEQFAQLHAAIRLVLPILPALTASSPVCQSRPGRWLDMRMQFVREGSEPLPFLVGDVVPEAVFDERTYREQIFAELERVIHPFDSDKIFDPNFLNARGAIARFDRGSIEIRVMDVQEYPGADVAACVATIAVLKSMVAQRWSSTEQQQQMPTDQLASLFDSACHLGENAMIDQADYLRHFGLRGTPILAGDLWRHLIDQTQDYEPMLAAMRPELAGLIDHGTLASRLLRLIGDDFRREHLREVYTRLHQCLSSGSPLVP